VAQSGNNAWKSAVMVLIAGASVEALGFAACKVLARQGLMYDPAPAATSYTTYLAERDTLLGWPAPGTRGHGEIDASGSRRVPAFPDPASRNCVAIFGDSFTWGEEVSPEDAYGNVLARSLGCRVANFGVGGYGTDQALLRYEQLQPEARVIVLGFFSDDIVRNVNQDRAFLDNTRLGLKPRFLVKNGLLELVPLPTMTENQYAHIGASAATLLPYDFFRPGGPSGLVSLHFPFSISGVRALWHYRVRAALRHEASYAEFYRPENSSGALEVTVAILRQFVATAKGRGQVPLVLLIPDVKDLESLRAHGTLPYQPLIDSLTANGVPFVSAAQSLNGYLGAKPPCALYFRCRGSHFRPDGYRELAKVVERAIQERGLLQAPP
jgi:GDSL-like lipase/acylhydrolase family protein